MRVVPHFHVCAKGTTLATIAIEVHEPQLEVELSLAQTGAQKIAAIRAAIIQRCADAGLDVDDSNAIAMPQWTAL